MNQKGKFFVVIGYFVAIAICGNYYTIGNIAPYLASYFNSNDNTTTISTITIV